MNISRPTMISVLKENTEGLTQMNKKQLWVDRQSFQNWKESREKTVYAVNGANWPQNRQKIVFSEYMGGDEILWKMLYFYIKQRQSVGK